MAWNLSARTGRTESERGNLLSLAFRFSTGWRHRGRLTCSIAVESMTPARNMLLCLKGICCFASKESDLTQESSHLRGNLAPRLGVYPVDPAKHRGEARRCFNYS